LRARRACLVVALASLSWSLLTLLTGGVALPLFSSRNPRNPALLAAVMVAAAWALADPRQRSQQLRRDLAWAGAAIRSGLARAWRTWASVAGRAAAGTPPVVAPMLAMGVAVAIIVTAVRYGQFVAAASDASGYVNQAHMWATWSLRNPEPLMAQLDGFLPREAMAPLAFRPSPEGATSVPVTSPGLPMLMALFEVLAGPRAVFAVVPLLAALAVWATYLLGREVDGQWTGAIAATLIASSPAFLFQLTSAPMSDIAAAAFWALSLAFAVQGRGLSSGVAAGMAILIRANLAPLAIVPGAIILIGPAKAGHYKSATAGHYSSADTRRHGLYSFAVGVVPAALFIAVLYTYWYGSPFNSGYGTLGQLYAFANVIPNVTRYSRWLLESQTPVVLAALVAPVLVSNRRAASGLLAFVAAVATCYVFYIPFDAWWFLRFLLPGFPALCVLTAATLVGVARLIPATVRVVTTLAALGFIVHHTLTYAAARATFDTGGEQKFAVTGRYIASTLPQDAVIFSEIHSGSIRYYSQRPTIRFGSVPPDHLEGAVTELHRLGYRPYLVAEDWEEQAFRRQFAGRSILASLDDLEVELPLGHVRIYPLAR
jgi:hypothetical protein